MWTFIIGITIAVVTVISAILIIRTIFGPTPRCAKCHKVVHRWYQDIAGSKICAKCYDGMSVEDKFWRFHVDMKSLYTYEGSKKVAQDLQDHLRGKPFCTLSVWGDY
jgi:hypothetical protein